MGRSTHKSQRTVESYMLVNGKLNESFYSDKPDKDLTALASYYGRKIQTERLVTITTGGKDPKAKYITKVTLLSSI